MSKCERIAELERKVAALTARIEILEARPQWTWTNPAPYIPCVGGPAERLTSINPTLKWSTGSTASGSMPISAPDPTMRLT